MKTIHLIAIAGLMALATSCNHIDKEEGRLLLSEARKQLVPYRKGANCDFINNMGRLVKFTVSDRQIIWPGADVFEDAAFSNYFLIEREVITLTAEWNNFEIRLCNEMNQSYTGNWELCWDNTSTLSIYLSNPLRSENKYFLLPCDKNGKFATDGTATLFHETVEINNSIYTDVIESRSGKDVLFYNQTYGILKVIADGKDYLIINR